MAHKLALLYQVALVAALMLLAAPSRVDAASNITCEQVTTWLTPCISYGVFGGTVAPECCQGIKDLNAAYHTKDDIRAACTCIQDGAAMIPGIDYDRINNIPGLCGTSCPYKVYPSTNCSKVV
ncbi:Lipid transfer protein/Par allergen [Parasponia andersonii]|uniref:Non-specific lipid-transfer protein n=1 Tax=Parasponia andersonii TaxID=3476 RepID=A0A2P5AME0_PARAD|nr:Lipid transfer protein/Par allergen [Parasponia andersonii]